MRLRASRSSGVCRTRSPRGCRPRRLLAPQLEQSWLDGNHRPTARTVRQCPCLVVELALELAERRVLQPSAEPRLRPHVPPRAPPAPGQALPLDGVPSHGRRHAGAMTAGTGGCRAGYAGSEVPADRHSCRVPPHRRSSPERGCGVGSRTNDESRVYERSALWRALWTKPDYVED